MTCTVVTVGNEPSGRDFDSWYRAEWPNLVAAVALVAGDRDVAQDITAEAFARALERWEVVSMMVSPEGWTYVVAVNALRRRGRRNAFERQALAGLAASASASAETEEPSELWKLVGALPERERIAVGLRYGAGLTEAEIAAALGVAVGTVSATLNHARQKLRTALTAAAAEETRRG
jgi:RNA polymerase sigma-70 factor (ECF subfamily)